MSPISFSRLTCAARTVFIYEALLEPGGGIAENLADISDREFDAMPLEWIRQQAEHPFLDRALARVRIGWLYLVSSWAGAAQPKARRPNAKHARQAG